MYSADYVRKQVEAMKREMLGKSDIVVSTTKLCLGWPYVWGGYGQVCTPKNRESFANRSSCPTEEAAVIRSKCQQLRDTSRKTTCDGCMYYPGNSTLFFDCRGFTRWLLQQVGINLQGAGATSQWNDDSNWVQKGDIKDIPKDKVCCVFMKNGKTMSHTGMHIGDGVIIHCSGEVKYGKITDRGWTNYAVPVGLDGSVPVVKPTIRRGSTGEYVVECQEDLIQLGYDLSPYGADGKFGARTETVVKAFQGAVGLKQDGIVGKMTWTALDEAVKPTTTLYTVTIKHLTLSQANELCNKYSNATKTEE